MWPEGTHGTYIVTIGSSLTVANVYVPTGGDTTMVGNFYAWSGPMPAEDIEDDRHNPKAWATWFREFLEELLKKQRGPAQNKEAGQRHPLLRIFRIRSGTQPREWVMKLWKQAH